MVGERSKYFSLPLLCEYFAVMAFELIQQFLEFVVLQEFFLKKNSAEFFLQAFLLEDQHPQLLVAEQAEHTCGLAERRKGLFVAHDGGYVPLIEYAKTLPQFAYPWSFDSLPGEDSSDCLPVDKTGIIEKMAEEQLSVGKGPVVVSFRTGTA
jgi:hypothetical protein